MPFEPQDLDRGHVYRTPKTFPTSVLTHESMCELYAWAVAERNDLEGILTQLQLLEAFKLAHLPHITDYDLAILRCAYKHRSRPVNHIRV